MTSPSAAKTSSSPFRFLKEAFEEFRKITWPTKEQAILLTAITVVVSAVVVVLIGALDLGLNELYQLATDNL